MGGKLLTVLIAVEQISRQISPLQPMNVLHLGPYDPTDRAWAAWSRGRKQTRDTLLMTCVAIPSSLVLSQFSVLPNVTAHATSV